MLAFVVKVRHDAALDSYLCPNAKHMFPIFIFWGGEEGYSCHLRRTKLNPILDHRLPISNGYLLVSNM